MSMAINTLGSTLESSRPSSRLLCSSLPICRHTALDWSRLTWIRGRPLRRSAHAKLALPVSPSPTWYFAAGPDAVRPPGMAGYGRSGNSPAADRASKRAAPRYGPRPHQRCESWLWSKDTDQWEKPWPDPAARDERVLAGLRNEKTWIVWDGDIGDIAAATVTITTRRNNAVWAKPACTADLAERAVFVHRLITSRKYAGLGLGAELIDWAGLRGCREYGAKWIRIDVWRTNTGLHDYYMSKGFKPCGICADPDYPSGALFEKPVAGIRVPAHPKFTETSADSLFTEPYANMEETAKFNLAAL